MRWLICFIFGHELTKWRYVKSVGRYGEVLKRSCKRCGRSEIYSGLTDISVNGNRIPYRKRR